MPGAALGSQQSYAVVQTWGRVVGKLSARKALGMLVGRQVVVSLQCAHVAKRAHGLY